MLVDPPYFFLGGGVDCVFIFFLFLFFLFPPCFPNTQKTQDHTAYAKTGRLFFVLLLRRHVVLFVARAPAAAAATVAAAARVAHACAEATIGSSHQHHTKECRHHGSGCVVVAHACAQTSAKAAGPRRSQPEVARRPDEDDEDDEDEEAAPRGERQADLVET